MSRNIGTVVVSILSMGSVYGAEPAKLDLKEKLPPADFTMKAEEYEKEFKTNSKAALAKYQGKTIELTGTVDIASPGILAPFFMINFASYERYGLGVLAMTKEVFSPGVIARGQQVRVRGKQTDKLEDAELIESVIVEKGPDTAVRTTANQLAKDATTDSNATKAKCDKKTVIVEGEVAAMKMDPATAKVEFLELKGDGATAIRCYFGISKNEEKSATAYRIGEKVMLVSQRVRIEKKAVVMTNCLPIRSK